MAKMTYQELLNFQRLTRRELSRARSNLSDMSSSWKALANANALEGQAAESMSSYVEEVHTNGIMKGLNAAIDALDKKITLYVANYNQVDTDSNFILQDGILQEASQLCQAEQGKYESVIQETHKILSNASSDFTTSATGQFSKMNNTISADFGDIQHTITETGDLWHSYEQSQTTELSEVVNMFVQLSQMINQLLSQNFGRLEAFRPGSFSTLAGNQFTDLLNNLNRFNDNHHQLAKEANKQLDSKYASLRWDEFLRLNDFYRTGKSVVENLTKIYQASRLTLNGNFLELKEGNDLLKKIDEWTETNNLLGKKGRILAINSKGFFRDKAQVVLDKFNVFDPRALVPNIKGAKGTVAGVLRTSKDIGKAALNSVSYGLRGFGENLKKFKSASGAKKVIPGLTVVSSAVTIISGFTQSQQLAEEEGLNLAGTAVSMAGGAVIDGAVAAGVVTAGKIASSLAVVALGAKFAPLVIGAVATWGAATLLRKADKHFGITEGLKRSFNSLLSGVRGLMK